MTSADSTFYQVSICCVFFGYKDRELKLLVRSAETGEVFFPQKKMQVEHSLYATASNLVCSLMKNKNYYIQQVGAEDSLTAELESTPHLTITYYVLTQCDNLVASHIESHPFYWISLNDIRLNSIQKKTVETALKKVRQIFHVRPVAFHMLPSLFTLSQFQHLYELILSTPVDKRNFRKKISDMNFIQQTDYIDKSSSKRGAHLYHFNPEMFRKSKVNFKI